MKLLKPFTASLYSEYLLTAVEDDSAEGDARGAGGEGKGIYERGLGETHGFPGDARKLRERSKIKLWKEYLASEHSIFLFCDRGSRQDATGADRSTLDVCFATTTHSPRKVVDP